MVDEPVAVPPLPTSEDIEAQRRRVFESLPAEVQANPQVRKSFGLGDAVEVLARPVARALGIRRCSNCERRKQRLNRVTLWRRSENTE